MEMTVSELANGLAKRVGEKNRGERAEERR